MPYIGNNHIAGDHTNNFKVLDDISSYTATFDGSAASVIDTTNNTIRVVEHRFIQGQRVTYTNGSGGNIGGLTTGTAYFVIFDSASTIKLATSASNAANSTAINLSAVGSGSSHTLNAAFDGVNTKFKLTHGSGTGARLNNATQINVAINNVVQRPNLDPNNFTDGFALEDNHKIVFKTAPTQFDIFWGSIIANTLTTFDISDHKIDTFTGNGSTTEFTLSHTPANNESLMVTINGVLQHPSNASTVRAYTLIASIIQFTSAPANGDEIQVRHLGFAGATTADVSGFYGRTGNVALTSNDHITTGNINAGIVTATSFHGSFSPNVGGSNANFTGIVTAGVFKGGDFDGRNLNISGIATFAGDVSIGGTLTYEDVTNIDSVGIITAQRDVHVGAGLSVVGISTFQNDVHLLDNDNLYIGGSVGTTDGIQILHNGSNTFITNNNRSFYFGQGSSASAFPLSVTAGNEFYLKHTHSNGGQNSVIKSIRGGAFTLYHAAPNVPSAEHVRLETTSTGINFPRDIDVDGHTNLDNVSIAGVTTITGASGTLLQVSHTAGSGGQGIIRTKASQANSSSFIRAEDSGSTYIGLLKYGTGHSAYGALGAGDGAIYANSGGGNDVNITIMADSSTGHINFATGGNTERLRIKSDGGILQTKTGGNANYTISRNESVGTTNQAIGVLDFASNTGHTVQARVMGKTRGTSDVGGDLVFETRADGGSLDERVRITGGGNVLIAHSTAAVTDAYAGNALEVGGSTYAKIALTSGTNTLRADWLWDDANVYFRTSTASNLFLGTDNTPRIKIANNSAATSIGGTLDFNAMLTVQGDISGELFRLKATEGTSRLMISGTNGNGVEMNLYDEAGGQKGILGVSGSEFFIKAPNSSAPIKFYTNNGSSIGERLRIASDGKVMIGTGTPQLALLHIAPADYSINLQNNSNNKSMILFSKNSAGNDARAWIEGNGELNGYLAFAAGDNERLRIDSSGKVFLHGTNATGANNTSALLPAGRTLNIHGTGSNDGISVVRYSGSYGAYGINIGRSRNDTFGTNTAVQDGDELGHVTFYGADGTNFDYAAQITGLCDGEVGTGGDATDMPGALSFRTTPEGSDTPTEKLRITSDGTVQYKTAGGKGYEFGASGSTKSVAANIFAPASYTLAFATNNEERLRIDSSGRLLVNGAAANQAFTGGDDLVIGNTSARSGITLVSSSSLDGGLYFSKGTSNDAIRGQIVYQHDNNGGFLRIYSNVEERIRLTSTGTVEFYGGDQGTEHIKIQSEAGGQGLYIANFQGVSDTGDSSSRLGVGKDDNILIFTNATASASQVQNFAIGNTDSIPLVLSTANTQRVHIRGDGKILMGIGIPTSGYTNSTLHVESPGIDLRNSYDLDDNQGASPHLTLFGSNSHVRLDMGTQNVGPYACYLQARYDNDPEETGTSNSGLEPLMLNPMGGAVGFNITTTNSYSSNNFNSSQTEYGGILMRGGRANTATVNNTNTAIKIYPAETRASSLVGEQDQGAKFGGIAWHGLDPHHSNGSWSSGYTGHHCWMGMSYHSTPGQELSNWQVQMNDNSSPGSYATNVAIQASPQGYVTHPNQPCMSVGLNRSDTNIGNYGDLFATYSSDMFYDVNQGDIAFTSSNGRFTIPIDGNYMISYYSIKNGAGVTGYAEIRVNGVSGSFLRAYSSNSATAWSTYSAFGIKTLAKGDYLNVVFPSSANNWNAHGRHHMRFVIALFS